MRFVGPSNYGLENSTLGARRADGPERIPGDDAAFHRGSTALQHKAEIKRVDPRSAAACRCILGPALIEPRSARGVR